MINFGWVLSRLYFAIHLQRDHRQEPSLPLTSALFWDVTVPYVLFISLKAAMSQHPRLFFWNQKKCILWRSFAFWKQKENKACFFARLLNMDFFNKIKTPWSDARKWQLNGVMFAIINNSIFTYQGCTFWVAVIFGSSCNHKLRQEVKKLIGVIMLQEWNWTCRANTLHLIFVIFELCVSISILLKGRSDAD